VLSNANVFPVILLQDLMQVSNPHLMLPPDHQDNAFFAQMTSYREVVGASGRRYLPINPHWVDALRCFAVGLLYAEVLDIEAKPPEDGSAGAIYVGGSGINF